LALSMALTGNWLQALLLLGIALLLLPPVRTLAQRLTGRSIHWWGWAVSIVVLLAAFVWLGSINKPTSIYRTPEFEAKFMEMYDAKMEAWPVPYEDVFVDTRYGKVHVIVSGPEDAPPALLFHAGALPSWSWQSIIEELNQHYRTYAVDAIGEVGKSVLYDVDEHTKDGQDIAELYAEISEALGVDQAYVIGASYGGFIGTNYAIYAPERVEKLVLIGPMGVTPATGSTLVRIMLLVAFPAEPVRDSFAHWMFGESTIVQEEIEEWYHEFVVGVAAKEAPPQTFTPEQLRSAQVPVLLILGKNDNLVGDPEKVKQLARNIPDIQIEVLNAGHGIWIEQPEQVNALITEFLEEEGR
jgi:pimeloyl-ACP methyl ester carboxylesterase